MIIGNLAIVGKMGKCPIKTLCLNKAFRYLWSQITYTMNEQNQEFDPRDLNKDGKVSVKEKLQFAADKAIEAADSAADAIREGAQELYGKVKDYQALSPEEKKAVQDQWKEKVSDAAEKVADSAKEAFEDVKEGAEKFFNKK